VSETPTDTTPAKIVGIDLGTTNSAVAWNAPGGRHAARIVDLPQLVAAGEIGRHPALPSFLYLPLDSEIASGIVAQPWPPMPPAGSDRALAAVAGVFARDHGALAPGRLIASAKSWLANPSVDRTMPLLPWGVEDGPRLSPVDASARLLAHIRDGWNYEFARTDERLQLASLPVVLTVPASFDEEARELTVAAAHAAGLTNLRLLEEPLAALYAWIARNRRLAQSLGAGALVLVCDVGGGTADFSLIRTIEEDRDLRFERIAIGEHLLLGGDNLDLALAALVEQKLSAAGGPRLTLTQRQGLLRKCSAAKERLLSAGAPAEETITILGAGRGVVAGGMSATLGRDEVERALTDGFLPMTAANDWPARDRRSGLRELGLPYESDPAITRHLAVFLAKAMARLKPDTTAIARPDFVLFNGGFFAPAIARARVLDALESWVGVRPTELENARPEAAVAIGAAFYGRLRHNPAAARRLLIRAGSARSYYVGVQTADTAAAGVMAVSVMPRGTQEGTSTVLEREFSVTSNQPLAFTLYSSTERSDPVGAIVNLADVHRHAPLVTSFRFGKRSRRVPITVRLRTAFTETGTLELWCQSVATEHRWRLSFNLRGVEADPPDESGPDDDAEGSPDRVVIDDDRLVEAARSIRAAFSPGAASPDALTGEIENALGHGRHAWPLGAIRTLADVLLEVEAGRRNGPAFEARWLNLTGFCARPGFGTPLDDWRISQLRKVYAAGLIFPKEVQNQVEWLVLWQRVSAGFSAGQQRELAQRVSGQLGVGMRKPPRVNPQIEREGWRLLGSLERLDPALRTKLGDEMVERAAREPRNAAWAWTVSRLGARSPLYGPLSSTVPPGVAARWVERLLAAKAITPDLAGAIVQIGAMTGDAARDVPEALRRRTAAALMDAGFDRDAVTPLHEVVAKSRAESVRAFGESIPEGLRLDSVGSSA
jgi:molecular chaperone DnaK (HSP70)